FARVTFRWWKPLWRKALQEAAQDRPRRRRIDEVPVPPDPEIEDRIAQVCRGLDAAADRALVGTRMRRDRLQGIKTVLYHLAPILVTRDGSISIRDLARATRMDDKTVRRARDAAKQDRRHGYERKVWVLLNDALAQLGPGERLATSQTRPAKLLRSMWTQRRWFRELSSASSRRGVRHAASSCGVSTPPISAPGCCGWNSANASPTPATGSSPASPTPTTATCSSTHRRRSTDEYVIRPGA
ncbi:hypothetical protein ACFXON_24720, partial [Bacillus subtilis]